MVSSSFVWNDVVQVRGEDLLVVLVADRVFGYDFQSVPPPREGFVCAGSVCF